MERVLERGMSLERMYASRVLVLYHQRLCVVVELIYTFSYFYFKMLLEHHHTRMIIYNGNSSRYTSIDVHNLIKCSPNYSDLKPNFDSTFTVTADRRAYFIWITLTWWRYSLAKIVFDCCLLISTQVRYDAK